MYEVSEAEASFLGVGLESQPTNEFSNNSTISSSTAPPESVAVKKPKSKKNSVYCLVREPEKVGDGLQSYVTYKVHTKPDNSDKPVISVRRYSDFLWLHDRLAEEFIEIIIPPVPEKVLVNTTSSETVDYRRRELEKFLKRVMRHEVLNKSQYLKYFLTANESDMATYRSTIKVHTRPNLIKEEQSFFSSSISWMQSAAQSVMSKTGQDYSLVKEVDLEFQETKQYFAALNVHFDNLHVKAADDVSKTRQLSEALCEFSHSAELMANCEASQDPVLSGYWKKLSAILLSLSELQEVLAKK